MINADQSWKQIEETRDFLKQEIGSFVPQFAIVLGSGLGDFGNQIDVEHTIPYERIPNFKPVGVVGHSGNLIFGKVAGKPVVCQQGRYHFYEGHQMVDVILPVRVMRALGAETLIVTNAAGGIYSGAKVGSIMIIKDHLNFQGTNPLIGPNLAQVGTRFPDMSDAYHSAYREKLKQIAAEKGIEVDEGVYLAVTGPSYETPAEITMFRTLGANAVGMSTVPEVIAANHAGLKVLGMSVITNLAAGLGDGPLDHSEVGEAAKNVSARFSTLVTSFIEAI